MKHLVKSQCNQCLYEQHKDWIERNQHRIAGYREKDPWTLERRCRRLGVSPKDFVDKFEEQEGKCCICNCNIDIVDSAIDHNHKTGEFRGVLCKKCNRGLGFFADSPVLLKRAYDYLINNGWYGDFEEDES